MSNLLKASLALWGHIFFGICISPFVVPIAEYNHLGWETVSKFPLDSAIADNAILTGQNQVHIVRLLLEHGASKMERKIGTIKNEQIKLLLHNNALFAEGWFHDIKRKNQKKPCAQKALAILKNELPLATEPVRQYVGIQRRITEKSLKKQWQRIIELTTPRTDTLYPDENKHIISQIMQFLPDVRDIIGFLHAVRLAPHGDPRGGTLALLP